MATTQVVRAPSEIDQASRWYIIGGLAALVALVYSDSIAGEQGLLDVWNSAQYSHGFLIPFFTAALLYMRQQPFEPASASARWGGVGLIVAGLTVRLFAARFTYITVDYLSMIPVLIGIFAMVGGWSALRWAWAPICFLIFMMPLPTFAEQRLLTPLQHVAAVMSNYTLQTLGIESFLSGNNITIDGNIPLNVAEACSGLRMSTIFLAMAVAMIMIMERPLWQNAIIIMSSVPIALITNMIRIVVTGLMFKILGPDSEFARTFFHDLAGWFMMPIALGFLYAEMVLLDHLVIEEGPTRPASMGFGSSREKSGDGGAPPPMRHPVASRR